MNKKLKIVLSICVVVVVIGAIIIFNTPEPDQGDRPTIKIGFIYPMTGSLGHIGKGALAAANMVLDKINQDPKRQFNYRLLVQDDEMKAANTVTIANKMLFVDKVHAVMTSWSGPSNAVKDLMKQHDMLHFIDTYMSLSDGKNIFNYSVTTDDLSLSAFDFIVNQKARNVALIFHQVPAGAEIFGMLKTKLKEKDIQYDDYWFNGNEFDAFRTMVAKVKSRHYDLILLYGWPPGINFVARELKSQEVTLPVLGFDTAEVANFDFTYFDGFYEVGNPYNPEWEKFLKSKNTDSVYMYDVMNIIVQTYEKAGKKLGHIPTTKEFREILYEQRDYQGLIGHAHLEDNGLFRVPTSLKKIEGDQILTIDPQE